MCFSDLMVTRLFKLETYLAPEESYHAARKALDSTPPPFRHRHDYFELFLIEKGETLHWINGRREVLTRGALCFIRPGDVHAFQSAADKPCRIFNVMFRPESAAHLQERYGAELGRRFFWRSGITPELFQLSGPRLERAINSMDELRHARRTLSRIEQFLLYMMTRVVDHSIVAPDAAPLWLANACVAARSPDVFRQGVSGFVQAAGRGHEHVCRVARKHLGMSPGAYIARIRMEHAAMLLATSDAPIPEVAAGCGIENLSHFYKQFGSTYGTTPRRYRVRHRLDPIQPVAREF